MTRKLRKLYFTHGSKKKLFSPDVKLFWNLAQLCSDSVVKCLFPLLAAHMIICEQLGLCLLLSVP